MVVNSRGVETFRIAARIRATNELVFVEAPSSAGTSHNIFRDCTELVPYWPEPMPQGTLPWTDRTRFPNMAHVMVSTYYKGEQGQGALEGTE